MRISKMIAIVQAPKLFVHAHLQTKNPVLVTEGHLWNDAGIYYSNAVI